MDKVVIVYYRVMQYRLHMYVDIVMNKNVMYVSIMIKIVHFVNALHSNINWREMVR